MLDLRSEGNTGPARCATLPVPLLCLVTDRRLVPEGKLADRVAQALAGGVGMVHLREKDLPVAALLPLAREIRAVCRDTALFIVNGNLEVALETEVDGVHLPEAGASIADVRRMVGPRILIGRSVHGLEAAVRAEAEGADYLVVGTMFETASKAGKMPEGVDLLRSVGQAVRIPLLGIGGIGLPNIGRVMQAGAGGAAVISAVLGAPDPTAAARGLMRAMVDWRAKLPAREHSI